MKGIYRRGSTYWIRYAGSDGCMIYESSKSTRQKDAERLLRERKTALDKGEVVVSGTGRITFSQLATQYLESCKSQRSYGVKTSHMNILITAFGGMPLKDITTQLVELFRSEYAKEHKPATCNRVVSTLSHCLRKAIDWGFCSESVLKRVAKLGQLRCNNRRTRFLSLPEIESLLSCCTGELRTLVTVALNTGLRRGELLKLRQGDIDYTHNLITVRESKNGEPRQVPMNEDCRSALQSLRQLNPAGKVFTYQNSTLLRHFQAACQKAGITDFNLHDCRHTCASHLVMAGVPLATVQQILGHKSIKMTLRYSHLAPQHLQAAVSQLYKNYTNELPKAARQV